MPLLLFLDPKEQQSIVYMKLPPEAFFRRKIKGKMPFRIWYGFYKKLRSAVKWPGSEM